MKFTKHVKQAAAYILTLLLFTGLIAVPAPTQAAERAISSNGFLKANGRDIRNQNGTGEIVYLRGTNAGGYLLQEFWMTPTQYSNNVNCEMGIYQTLTNRFGEAAMRTLVDVYQDNYWTAADFDNCKALGMNVIRLPFWYMNFVDFNGNYLPNAFERIDWFIEEAGKRDLYVILDMHGAPGSQNGSDHSGIDGGDSKEAMSKFFFGPEAYQNQQLYYDIWYKLAQRYKDNPVVAGYDLLNEPYCTYRYNSSKSDSELHSLLWGIYNNAYNVIRSVDQNHLVIMEATWNPSDLPNPADYNWQNVMYEYHNYLYDDYDNANGGQIRSMQDKLNSIASTGWNIPSYIGEFTYFNNMDAWRQGLALLNNANVHWTTWTYRVTGTGSTWGLYNQNVPAANVSTDSYDTIYQKWSNVGNATPNTTLINAVKNYFSAPGAERATLPNGDYYLTAIANNQVVCADDYGNEPLSANRTGFGGDWEKFTLVNNSDGTISLRSGANNLYVCAVIDESNQLLARSSAINDWEKFELIKVTANQYALRSIANGRYVAADLNNGSVLTARSTAVAGAWEAFLITPTP